MRLHELSGMCRFTHQAVTAALHWVALIAVSHDPPVLQCCNHSKQLQTGLLYVHKHRLWGNWCVATVIAARNANRLVCGMTCVLVRYKADSQTPLEGSHSCTEQKRATRFQHVLQMIHYSPCFSSILAQWFFIKLTGFSDSQSIVDIKPCWAVYVCAQVASKLSIACFPIGKHQSWQP